MISSKGEANKKPLNLQSTKFRRDKNDKGKKFFQNRGKV
jgi:hypothetical protein